MKLSFSITFILVLQFAYSQFTHADSLRGGYGSGRNWWNLTHYDLHVAFDIENQTISGKNVITYEFSILPTKAKLFMQLDLQEPMILDSVTDGISNVKLPMTKDGNAYFIRLDRLHPTTNKLTAYFHGKPRKAVMPPWDGGVIWSKDVNNKPWITVACQGLGSSVWFPCKDSQYDEPDAGVTMHYTCPEELVCVSNGMFIGKQINSDQTATYSWKVKNPINNYCMIPYIGDYVNLHEHYIGEQGVLELDYWVLRGNEQKAETHFQDVPRTLKALEYWFGPYPFYQDGYKLVEAPHLGMEHQSAVAYGNGFKNGYQGSDLSGTGEGLKWDFIIVHESGHEWFGNNITSKDIADMWIHEGFTSYSETLFTHFWYGREAGDRYNQGIQRKISNDRPIIGSYGVHKEGSGDMYNKGSAMLHTIRTLVQDDILFRNTLRGLNLHFYHQTVTTEQVEEFMSRSLKMDLSKIFDRYLRQTNPPTIKITQKKNKVTYAWVNVEEDFNMPIVVDNKILPCSTEKRKVSVSPGTLFSVDPNMYVWKIEKRKP